MELVVRLADAVSVVRVDDEDQALGVGVVVPPEWTDLVLPADVPHRRGLCREAVAGERCQGNCTPAEHTTGVSDDGMTCDCTEGFAGEFCQFNCTGHGGASADGMACANCTECGVNAM
eukprot:COSAG04_NODE_1_length_58448_cov_23.476478_23_plen_118_part_00